MGKYNGKSCRIISMLVLTTSFLLVEIIVGHLSNSLALIADAFHMLSDTLALIVGLVAVKLARRVSSNSNTYGWARAEIVGALVNAVFLVALSFTILVEAVERLALREEIHDAQLLLYVGGAGLAINLFGLLLFHNHAHGHTHGGMPHTHSHGHSHNSSDKPNKTCSTHSELSDNADCTTKLSSDVSSDADSDKEDPAVLNLVEKDNKRSGKKGQKKIAKSHQLNMRGVFIHVLGDALGSVVVMISATITILARKYLSVCDVAHHHHILNSAVSNVSTSINMHECLKFTEPEWVKIIDPILSLVLVAIILSTSVPLLKQSGMILMQMVPAHLEVSLMQQHIEQIEGILDVHEFHVWCLAGNKVVASMHVHTECIDDYVSAAQTIKDYLHHEGIHSVTIQPEFTHLQKPTEGRRCTLECGPDKGCHTDTCCAKSKQAIRKECAKRSSNSPV